MSQKLMRNAAIGAVGIGAFFYLFPRTAAKVPVGNVFETPAVKSVAARHSSGGGSDTHTPGVATQRGDASATVSNQQNPKGVDTEHFKQNMTAQKVAGSEESNAFAGSAFYKAQYGQNNEKGK
ncbi:hypothetical protein LTR62_003754 [Meristemomyces frigidus]|uniref:Uncharacterized protein n=1 Tax=Meristemomyces frigidus TaxID=1508187 RepID=A0AAN7TRG6_9PEZI|nr:hypothetical protein LTR62_003754 [Meristemomyces frigidus]